MTAGPNRHVACDLWMGICQTRLVLPPGVTNVMSLDRTHNEETKVSE